MHGGIARRAALRGGLLCAAAAAVSSLAVPAGAAAARSRPAAAHLPAAAVRAVAAARAGAPRPSGAPLGGPPVVLTTPVRVAATSDGAVAYRELGSGPPLVLVTGLGATMDDWTASFVDSLAEHHRVVIFDNAGVGKTAARSPLTITAMAEQTSALIDKLGLTRPAVLGWSMGGMTAQALAVLDPSQVSRLVLCATQPGTGKSAPVPLAAAEKLDSSNPAVVLSDLFPANQVAAAQRYGLAVLRFTPYYSVSAAVRTAQGLAVEAWLTGTVAAGRETSKIAVPTLVADGTDDALDPVSNDHLLAATIHGSQLALYPDAGHAFWFQDERAFLAKLEAFLG
ncbi:MAG TPA: alpha/beta hydrolase [Acidimicrobiales bacterium]|nr:alpha/beta hydrolase [Acidimicrobiales bacterium]